MNQQEKRKCIIKSNKDIKQMLLDKITQQSLSYSDVVNEARKKHGRKFTLSMLSRYFNMDDDQLTGQLTQEDIVWLCDRYGLEVHISVRKVRSTDKANLQKIRRKYGKLDA